MWVDESGGSDTDASSPDAMTVHVDGQEYQAEVNYDVNEDGVNDTAIVEHDDGTAQAFIDTNHDGVADQYAVLDSTGHVTEQAVYDEASGQWIESSGGGQDDSGGSGHHDVRAHRPRPVDRSLQWTDGLRQRAAARPGGRRRVGRCRHADAGGCRAHRLRHRAVDFAELKRNPGHTLKARRASAGLSSCL